MGAPKEHPQGFNWGQIYPPSAWRVYPPLVLSAVLVADWRTDEKLTELHIDVPENKEEV
jgi:hypothetical protein